MRFYTNLALRFAFHKRKRVPVGMLSARIPRTRKSSRDWRRITIPHPPPAVLTNGPLCPTKNILTNPHIYDIVDGRMEELRSFFYAQNQGQNPAKRCKIKAVTNQQFKWRWKSCAQELHWHVQNANNVITTWLRIRRLILTEWKQRSIADSVKHIRYTKKQNKVTDCTWDQAAAW